MGPLAPGAWYLTVTDSNGCITTYGAFCLVDGGCLIVPSATLSFTVELPTSASCYGGSNGYFIVQVTGGTGEYTVRATPAGNMYLADQQAVSVTGTSAAPIVIPNLASGDYLITVIDTNNCTTTSAIPYTIGQPSFPLGVSINAVPEICSGFNNGSITITASGGTPPYSFSIQAGAPGTYVPNSSTTPPVAQTFSPLTPGTYAIVVMDANGCTTPAITQVLLPAVPIHIETRQISPTCPGGSDGRIIVTASGGTAPLTYALVTPATTPSYNNIISDLTAGKYQVVVTDAIGCQAFSDVVEVPAAAPFFIESVHITPISCSGAADARIDVHTGGGLAPVLYTLDALTPTSVGPSADPVFTNVEPGVHTITVTDANVPPCTLTYTTKNIIDPTTLTLVTSTFPALCAGQASGAIIVMASGGTPPYRYSMDGGATFGITNEFVNVAAGSYSVVLQDAHGCTVSSIVTVSQASPVTITGISTTNPTSSGIANGMITIAVTGGAGNYTYSINGGNTFVASNTFTGLTAGTYYIVVMDQNGCSAKGIVKLNQLT